MRLAAFVGAAILALPCASAAQDLSPGDIFVDCENVCPQMVVIPPGQHLLGAPLNDDGSARQRPAVHFGRPFAIGRFEITFDEWDACVADGVCRSAGVQRVGADWDRCRARGFCSPLVVGGQGADEGWGRGRRPVINVTQSDAHQYLTWLSERSGQTYRLPTNAEWSYAAAGGVDWPDYSNSEPADVGNFGQIVDRTLPAGAFPANRFGLFDTQGNVSELVTACENPADGPMLCAQGGNWLSPADRLEVPHRPSFLRQDDRHWGRGFRVVREM